MNEKVMEHLLTSLLLCPNKLDCKFEAKFTFNRKRTEFLRPT